MAPPQKTTSNKPAYIKQGEYIMARSKDVWYLAKVINENYEKNGRKGIFVHYKGWGKRHDEPIYENEYAERTKESTAELIQQAEDREASSKAMRKEKKKKILRIKEEGSKKDSHSAENSTNGDEETAASEEASVTQEGREKTGPGRPAKRKHAEIERVEPVVKNDSLIVLPSSLKKILTDDYDYINRQFMICRNPPKHTVTSIFKEYCDQIRSSAKDDQIRIEYDDGKIFSYTASGLIQNAKGLRDYFDCLLPAQLLYKLERLRFEQLKQEVADKMAAENPESSAPSKSTRRKAPPPTPAGAPLKASDHYGLPHLLRLLTRIESCLKWSNFEDRCNEKIMKTVGDFIVFLNKNRSLYMEGHEYENTSNEYQRETFG